ncbi:MAG: penicillin-binding protein 2 [Candidatus Shapirobacteria bacterium]|jgi:cell division protein FtsI/penicillin-binding protein 2
MFSTRVGSLSVAIITSFIVILGRIIYWQFYTPTNLRRQETSQNYSDHQIDENQGKIYYKDHSLLAGNKRVYKLSLYKPNLDKPIEDVRLILEKEITNLLPQDKIRLRSIVEKPNLKWVDFETEITKEQYQKISTIAGLEFKSKTSRYYPESDLSQNLFFGIESYYRRQLQGKPGYFYSNQDALGLPVLTQHSLYIEPVDGLDLSTSIDRRIQYLTETTIADGINKYSADSGMAIVLDPQSGAVLSLVSLESSPSANQNSKLIDPISHLFEPGSIFKPLVVAAALDSNSISDDYVCPKCDQPFIASGFSINNWDKSFHPNTDIKDIIKNSDNIGMSNIVFVLGQKQFLKYFNLLGLDKKTGIDLPSENISPVKSYWSDIDLATASFGQGLAVTPIQMIQAFNSLANSGKIVHPHINLNNPIKPPIKVYSENTVEKINQILSYAVNNGVVSQFKPKDLDVCAKSGTAQVAINGQYSDNSFIASYIGYSPCRHPKFTLLITLSNPKSSSWGSSTAAPLWFSLAEKIDKLL